MPETYPRSTRADLDAWRKLGYRDLAFEIFSRSWTTSRRRRLRDIVDRTYTAAAFGSDDITPLTTLEPGLHLLHLSNGPTLAFKDVAMQLLGNLFEYVLAKRGESLNILGATSGDTGLRRRVRDARQAGRAGVHALAARGKMSPFQTAQMYSLQDANIFNIAVKRRVRRLPGHREGRVSNDLAFKAKYRIGTVNSINWARLVAQVVYYFKGYFAATKSNDEQVTFSVPSGNFGNVCAGHVARMMGLPVRRLVLATNENDVLDEFFRTGRYRVRAARPPSRQTSSPSMDISKASNFERFVFDLVGARRGRSSQISGGRSIPPALRSLGHADFARIADFGFVSGRSSTPIACDHPPGAPAT
jgi:threonine synthase